MWLTEVLLSSKTRRLVWRSNSDRLGWGCQYGETRETESQNIWTFALETGCFHSKLYLECCLHDNMSIKIRLNAFSFPRVSDNELAKLQAFDCAASWTEGRPALWSTSSWILSLPTDKDRTEISVMIWHVIPVRPGERSLPRRVMRAGSPLSCHGMGRIKSAEWESLGRGWPGDCRRLAAGAASAVTCCEIAVTLLSVTRGGSATEMPRAFLGWLSWCLEMEWRGLYESVLSSTVCLEQTWQWLHCPRGGAQTISDLSPCRISRSSVSVSSIMIPWEPMRAPQCTCSLRERNANRGKMVLEFYSWYVWASELKCRRQNAFSFTLFQLFWLFVDLFIMNYQKRIAEDINLWL